MKLTLHRIHASIGQVISTALHKSSMNSDSRQASANWTIIILRIHYLHYLCSIYLSLYHSSS